jgi:serine/threonine protein kinase
MYSNVDMIWKFIDFDLSLETSKCKFETSRRVGTRDYIAPESEATGIYSESSDVFSLGSVIFDIVHQVYIVNLLMNMNLLNYWNLNQ